MICWTRKRWCSLQVPERLRRWAVIWLQSKACILTTCLVPDFRSKSGLFGKSKPVPELAPVGRDLDPTGSAQIMLQFLLPSAIQSSFSSMGFTKATKLRS